METIFNPSGRIGPVTFRNVAIILIAIGAVFSLLPLALPQLMFASFAGLVLVYPWVVIWVKRFHDAGKSGKLFLVVLVLYLIASWGVGYFISKQFGVAPVQTTNPADLKAIMAAQIQATALPNTIAAVIISLAFVFIVNGELKSDPETNEYGRPPAR